jgi:hypothetical protein
MAETTFKIILEGATQVETGLDGVSKAYSEVGAASKKAGNDSSKAFKETTTEADKLNDTLAKGLPKTDFKKPLNELTKLKQEVKALQGEALKAGEGTKEFARLMQVAADKKAQIKDLGQAISALDPDTKAKAFLQLSQTIVTGFAAGSGALSAFGVTTEDAQKTLVKLQAAMAFGQFLGELQGLGDTFEILKTQINNSAVAQKAFNLIAAANPYVLTAVAIGGLTVAMATLTTTAEEDTDAFLANSEAVKKSREARADLQKQINSSLIDLKVELGIISESEGKKEKLRLALFDKEKEIQKKFGEEKQKLADEIDGKFFQSSQSKQIALNEGIKRLSKIANDEINDLYKKQGIDERLIDAKDLNDKIKALKEKNAKEKELADEAAKKKKADELKFQRDLYSLKQKEIDKSDDELLKSQESLNEKKDALEKQSGEKTIANIEYVNEKNKEAAEKQLELNKQLAAEEATVTQAKFGLASQLVRGFSDVLAQDEKTRKEYASVIKGLALAEIAINLARTIVANNTAAALNPLNAVTAGAAGVTQAFYTNAAAIAAASFQVAAILAQGFHDGGYTGNGDEHEMAGVVHKGEFVMTKEKTAKHKGLFEKIHNDEKLSLLDLAPLLKGTGVGLLPNVAEKSYMQISTSEAKKMNLQNLSDKNIAELNENFKKFLAQQNNKSSHKIMGDGTEIFKKGNTTRIVRRRRI